MAAHLSMMHMDMEDFENLRTQVKKKWRKAIVGNIPIVTDTALVHPVERN